MTRPLSALTCKIFAFALAAALASCGQTQNQAKSPIEAAKAPPSADSSTPKKAPEPNPKEAVARDSVPPVPLAAPAQPLQALDKRFVERAAQGAMAEVAMARLALKRSGSSVVKEHAQRMLDDLSKANADLLKLTEEKGIAWNASMQKKNVRDITALKKLSGTQFDQAYLKRSGVAERKARELLFRNEARNGEDVDLRSYAEKYLPVVREHLSMSVAATKRWQATNARPSAAAKSSNDATANSTAARGESSERTPQPGAASRQ
jgi:putative membrane protein